MMQQRRAPNFLSPMNLQGVFGGNSYRDNRAGGDRFYSTATETMHTNTQTPAILEERLQQIVVFELREDGTTEYNTMTLRALYNYVVTTITEACRQVNSERQAQAQQQQQQQPHQQSIQLHHQMQSPAVSIPQSSPQYLGQSTLVRSSSVENTVSTSDILKSSGQGVSIGQHLQHNNPNFKTITIQDGMASVPSNPDLSIPIQQSQNTFSMSSSTFHYDDYNAQNAASTILPKSSQSIQSIPESTSTGLSIDEGGSDVEDDSVVDTEELRRLELEFEKKMQRAKKSYGTRMDNLHRSKEEAEAQHQMTLEKHEKERIEFEKRVRLAEEEQNRRLNQIQKEFIEKKHQVRQQRSRHAGIPNGDRPPLHGGHKRSSSHFDSSFQQQPPSGIISEHRRTNSCSEAVSETNQPAAAPSSVGSSGEMNRQPGQNGAASTHTPIRQTGNEPRERVRSGSTSS
mmetsp:Transcript_17834/g.37171  ORF Transcript_17834/g.37171 Transcript_17834/m.37171 type:complete len:456 (-) Transcript_17834:1906-3273(-)